MTTQRTIDKRLPHLRYKGEKSISGREKRGSKVREAGINMIHHRSGNSAVHEVSRVLADNGRRK